MNETFTGEMKRREREGAGSPGVSDVCPPAYLRLWWVEEEDTGSGGLSGTTEKWRQGVPQEKRNCLEGSLVM